MPQYNYRCKSCNKGFSIYTSMSDSRSDICCDSCSSNDVYRDYSRISTKSSGGSSYDMDTSMSDYSSPSSGGGCGTCTSGGCGTCH